MGQTVTTVDYGATSTGLIIGNDEELLVLSGGTASSTAVRAGGGVTISAGGSGAYTIVSGFGAEFVYGQTTFDQISGIEYVDSGGIVSSATVEGAIASQIVTDGGVTIGTTVLDYGTEFLYSGGVSSDTAIGNGGAEIIFSGGIASDTAVSGGGYEIIEKGGSAVDDPVLSGGVEIISSGGVDSGTIIQSGGVEIVSSGAIASDTEIQSGGAEIVYSGATVSDATVDSDGILVVLPGGTANTPTGSILSTGGVLLYGPVSGATNEGPSPSGLVVSSGMTELVLPGAAPTNDMILYGGTEDVYGTASLAMVQGQQVISGGGQAISTTVEGGGQLVISSGGEASFTVVSNGGDAFVYAGGVDSGSVLTGPGAYEFVSGGAATGAVLSSGVQIVFSGGSAEFTAVSGGDQIVYNSGLAQSTVVISGDQIIYSGGVAESAIVSGGGEYVYSGGVASDTVISGGDEDVYSSGVSVDATVDSGGSQYVYAGATTGTVVNAGGGEFLYSGATGSFTTVSSGGDLDVASGGVSISATILSGGLETIGSGGVVRDSVLEIGGTIDIADLAYVSSGGSASVDGDDNLMVTEGGVSVTISLAGDYSGDVFSLSQDTAGSGTDVTAVAPCYCSGSLIQTEAGEVPVETLKIGDRVVTASGAIRPIKWIGRRSYSGRFARGSKDILPIRIRQGALDKNTPRRDLMVSPHHALYLDGVLIEACDLINGVSIVQAESVESVTYIHIELDTHDIILAEGAPAESFVDDDSRMIFHNAHDYRALYPDEASKPPRYCAPRLRDGYAVEAARRRIEARAGLVMPEISANLALRGYIDRVDGVIVAGWAQNPDYPEAPVCLDIYAGGDLIGQTIANRYRPDLARAGLGSGRHGFVFTLPAGLVGYEAAIDVRRSLDGRSLGFSREARALRRG